MVHHDTWANSSQGTEHANSSLEIEHANSFVSIHGLHFFVFIHGLQVRQELEERPSVHLPPLLLGGTSLLSPIDVARQMVF